MVTDEKSQVCQESVTNGASFQDIMSDTSFQEFYDTANDMLRKASCEENFLRKERCKKVLLSMHIEMMKGGEVFQHEKTKQM